MNNMNSSCNNLWNRKQYQPVIFNNDIQPNYNSGYSCLNELQRAMDFTKVENPGLKNCSKILFYQQDPRLIDIRRGNQIYPISEPPFDGGQPFKPNNFEAKIYKNGYQNIKGGQIQYYVDKSIEDAFFEPTFINQRNVTSYTYIDPMNNIKPHYERQSDYYDNPGYSLSFMKDSQEFREDIISKQMSKINQSRYEPLYKK
jgi:hypothetical protein